MADVKFRIIYSNHPHGFDMTGRYKVLSNGCLVVQQTGKGPIIVSPSGWVSIEVLDAPTFEELVASVE